MSLAKTTLYSLSQHEPRTYLLCPSMTLSNYLSRSTNPSSQPSIRLSSFCRRFSALPLLPSAPLPVIVPPALGCVRGSQAAAFLSTWIDCGPREKDAHHCPSRRLECSLHGRPKPLLPLGASLRLLSRTKEKAYMTER